MRLGQIKSNNQIIAAIFEGELAQPIPNHTVLDLIRRSEEAALAPGDIVSLHIPEIGELSNVARIV